MICEWFDLKTTQTIFSDLASKLVATVFSDLVLKPVARVFQFGSQNRQIQFGDLCIKIIMTVSWFGIQNQADFSFSVTPQN
jgi:hypothetical protein